MAGRDFGTLAAPTGSGKTVMALALMARRRQLALMARRRQPALMARRRQPALIVVHTKELMDQWIARIEEFLGISAREVGRIGGGKQIIGDKISVALVQTLCKCAPEIAHHIGFLIVD